MRRRISLLVAVAMMATLAVAAPAAADHDSRDGEHGPIYLSLGTSLAAGTVADANGDSIPFSNKSYTDQLYRRIRWVAPSLEHVKLGCPGETTLTFEFGGICDAGGPLNIYEGSQLKEAMDVLASGRVKLVTIDMGANDILQATPDLLACGVDLVCVDGILEPIAENVQNVVAAVKAVDPNVPVLAMNYYNPNIAAWLGFFSGVPAGVAAPDPDFAVLSDALSQIFNGKLAAKYAEIGVPVADVARAYRASDFADRDGDGIPNNVERVCKLTSMCPDDGVKSNIHANKRGYRVIAKTFIRTIIRMILTG